MTAEFSLKNEDVILAASAGSIDSVQEVLDKFIETARVEAVYGQPIQHGSTLIIPAAEVLTGMGFGMGFGGGSGSPEAEEADPGEAPSKAGKPGGSGAGGGGGGGGQSLSRPVAVIIVDEHGVRIEPVFDRTKVALAALTAIGFSISMLAHMRKNQRS